LVQTSIYKLVLCDLVTLKTHFLTWYQNYCIKCSTRFDRWHVCVGWIIKGDYLFFYSCNYFLCIYFIV